jgi:hypothetical protein
MAEVVEAVVVDEGSKQDSKGRRILDEAQWADLIGQYHASGLTQGKRRWGQPLLF